MKWWSACLFLLLSVHLYASPLPGLPPASPNHDQVMQPNSAPTGAETGSSIRNWQQLTFWIMQKQRELHRGLADKIEQLSEQGGWDNARALLLLSFFYGVFHAAGPGHGKAVLTTYLLTQPEKLQRGLWLSFVAAILQAVTAILLVTLLVHVLGRLAREAFSSVFYVEVVSFGLIAVLGLVLIIRGIRQFWQLRCKAMSFLQTTPVQQPQFKPISSNGFTPVFTPLKITNSNSAAACPSCGKVHHVAPEQTEGKSWVQNTGLLLSIGLRPCSGAVLVLVVANLLGLWWVGVAASVAMALGTALTVAVLATLAVQVRQLAYRLLHLQGQSMARVAALLAITGGLVILLLGVSLLLGSLNTDHPLGLF